MSSLQRCVATDFRISRWFAADMKSEQEWKLKINNTCDVLVKVLHIKHFPSNYCKVILMELKDNINNLNMFSIQ
jgi:hypothetical protein